MASVKGVNYNKIGFAVLAHGQKTRCVESINCKKVGKAELAHGQKMKFLGHFENKFASTKINLLAKKETFTLNIL